MQRLFFLILMLTIVVAGREVPECVSLADDVSNDGEIPACSQQSAPQSSAKIPCSTWGGCNSAGFYRTKENPYVAPAMGTAAIQIGTTILLLLCEQRK